MYQSMAGKGQTSLVGVNLIGVRVAAWVWISSNVSEDPSQHLQRIDVGFVVHGDIGGRVEAAVVVCRGETTPTVVLAQVSPGRLVAHVSLAPVVVVIGWDLGRRLAPLVLGLHSQRILRRWGPLPALPPIRLRLYGGNSLRYTVLIAPNSLAWVGAGNPKHDLPRSPICIVQLHYF